MRARRMAVMALLVLATHGLTACTAQRAEHREGAATTDSAAAPPELADADLWLSFDDEATGQDGSAEFPDADGRKHAGRVVTANGGALDRVAGPDGRGAAAGFPSRCEAASCPRVMVELPADSSLDPAERPFSYGATVWLSPDQTAAGSNIVQQGRFGSIGGQWKLQVDGEDGRPSCVIRSGTEVWTVRHGTSVADESWHRVVCRRDASGISISVDGDSEQEEGGAGSVSNDLPIRIGSPGLAPGDDQFHGRLDDVFLAIDPVA